MNLGGGEVLVILLLALVVLGPQRLPDAARQIGRFMGEMRRVSSGFQRELRSALDDPVEAAARERGRKVVPARQDAPAVAPAPAPAEPPKATLTAAKKAATKKAAAKKAPARKRAAPLRASDAKPTNGSTP